MERQKLHDPISEYYCEVKKHCREIRFKLAATNYILFLQNTDVSNVGTYVNKSKEMPKRECMLSKQHISQNLSN